MSDNKEFLDQIVCSLWLLRADSSLLSLVGSAGKEISVDEAIEGIRAWNKATAKEQKEVLKIVQQCGIE